MPSLPLTLILGFVLPFHLLPLASSESATCVTVYDQGGAPAVFRSPKCPRWNLFPDDRRVRPVFECQVATRQGRRRSMEDRAVCVLDFRIPFASLDGVKHITVEIAAVFDGHNGSEASEAASKLFLEYFSLHVHFILDRLYSAAFSIRGDEVAYYEHMNKKSIDPYDMEQQWLNFNLARCYWILSRIFDRKLHLEILKESLLRTIRDIDITFSKEALRENLGSGSTAVVVLVAHGHILAANLGDSKAILCSEQFDPPDYLDERSLRLSRRARRKDVATPKNVDAVSSYKQKYIHVKELTEDHHPDREDEKNRVEAAGGFVDWAGVPRVNGQLAVSRSIGDVALKSYGVISTPEVTDWQPLGSNDSYVVVASDGIFDKLNPQETCDLLWDANINLKSELIYTLADYIVNTAFERGSTDNLAIVVVPLKPFRVSKSEFKDVVDMEASMEISYLNAGNGRGNKSLISADYYDRITTNFKRLVVETNITKLGCFYLYENLNGNKDREILQLPDYNGTEGLVSFKNFSYGATRKADNDNIFCSLLGLDLGDNHKCIDPENFEKFLALLDSIPFSGTGSNYSNSFDQKPHDMRYVLERQFGGGSYGEVWLAFQWNCSKKGGTFIHQHKVLNCIEEDKRFSSDVNSSSGYQCSDFQDDGSYILKRIKVEKGNGAYRSGLREKYFGEMFLKASQSYDNPMTSGVSTFFSSKGDNFCPPKVNRHFLLKMSPAYPSYKFSAAAQEGLRHIARFVEYFESPSEGIWLVFHNEGLSLKKLLYTEVGNDESDVPNLGMAQAFRPSSWWHWLRTTETGKREMQNLIRQLLTALRSSHARGITHRDVKPENIIICFGERSTGRCLKRIPKRGTIYHLNLRLIDFGSAIDSFTIKYLYGDGPSRFEQTYAYTAPEALLNASWFEAPDHVRTKYDIWSVGVFIMELILGSSDIFQTNARTRALIYQKLDGWRSEIKELTYKLRSYMDMCVLIPKISPENYAQKCSEESFQERIKERDPLKLGFPNIWALRLVRQLLAWLPEDRLSVDEALQHPYFMRNP